MTRLAKNSSFCPFWQTSLLKNCFFQGFSSFAEFKMARNSKNLSFCHFWQTSLLKNCFFSRVFKLCWVSSKWLEIWKFVVLSLLRNFTFEKLRCLRVFKALLRVESQTAVRRRKTERISCQNVAAEFCASEKSWNPSNLTNVMYVIYSVFKINGKTLVFGDISLGKSTETPSTKGNYFLSAGSTIFDSLPLKMGAKKLSSKNFSRFNQAATFKTTANGEKRIISNIVHVHILISQRFYPPKKKKKTPKSFQLDFHSNPRSPKISFL